MFHEDMIGFSIIDQGTKQSLAIEAGDCFI